MAFPCGEPSGRYGELVLAVYAQNSITRTFKKTFPLVASLSNSEFTLLQIQLLLQYLKNDPRKAVKRLAIQDLKLLANKTPHTWSRENIQVDAFF